MIHDYPYPFGHFFLTFPIFGISSKGGPFAGNPLRVTATFSYFVSAILSFPGATFLTYLFIQHGLGLATALLAYRLTRRMTGSPALANVALIAIGLNPRGLLYEHIFLPETLYVFLFFALVECGWHALLRPSWFLALALGVLAGSLVVTRGQGVIAPPIAFLFLAIGLYAARSPTRRAAGLLALFVVPAISIPLHTVLVNARTSGIAALSVNGSYNLLWVSSANLIDFESDSNADLKEIARPCIVESNRDRGDSEAWAMTGERCLYLHARDFPNRVGQDWRRLY